MDMNEGVTPLVAAQLVDAARDLVMLAAHADPRQLNRFVDQLVAAESPCDSRNVTMMLASMAGDPPPPLPAGRDFHSLTFRTVDTHGNVKIVDGSLFPPAARIFMQMVVAVLNREVDSAFYLMIGFCQEDRSRGRELLLTAANLVAGRPLKICDCPEE